MTFVNNLTFVEHPEWGDLVWRRKNGSIRDPMSKAKSDFVFQFNLATGSFGLPLNLYAALIILLDPNLRNKSHYVIKLNLILSNLLAVFSDGQEVAYHICPSEFLCHSSIITWGWSNRILLFNILLSIIHRLLATKPLLYRQLFTPSVVFVSSAICNLMLLLLLNWVYVFGVSQVRCAYQIYHAMTLLISGLVLLFLCCVSLIWLYIKTKPNPSTVSFNNDPMNHNSPVATTHQKEPQTDSLIEAVGEALAVVIEKELTHQYIPSLVLILILPFITGLMGSSAFVCLQFFSSDSSGTCRAIQWLATYDNKLSSINAIISPLITIWRNPAHHNPIWKCCKRLRHRPHSSLIRINNFRTTMV